MKIITDRGLREVMFAAEPCIGGLLGRTADKHDPVDTALLPCPHGSYRFGNGLALLCAVCGTAI